MTEKKPGQIELVGRLTKVVTVGYRSPYRLAVTEKDSRVRWTGVAKVAPPSGDEPLEIELRGKYQLFEQHLGREVRVVGAYVFQPTWTAEPGTEAATRFLGGVGPVMQSIEVRRIVARRGARLSTMGCLI